MSNGDEISTLSDRDFRRAVFLRFDSQDAIFEQLLLGQRAIDESQTAIMTALKGDKLGNEGLIPRVERIEKRQQDVEHIQSVIPRIEAIEKKIFEDRLTSAKQSGIWSVMTIAGSCAFAALIAWLESWGHK
jgi:hypothetical protein